MPDIPFKSNAVIVYVVRQGERGAEVLYLKRAKKDALDAFWLHVAGKIEPGEKAWQAAIRELREETGISTDTFYNSNHLEKIYSASSDAIIMLPMFVAMVPPDQDVVLNAEHSEYKWFTIDEAFQAVPFANQRECLTVVNENFIKRSPAEFLRIKP